MLSATERDGILTLDIVVQPRASREGLSLMGDRLKISVTAPPVDGKANDAVIRALAAALDVPRGAIEIARGDTSRRKTVRIRGVTLATPLTTAQRRPNTSNLSIGEPMKPTVHMHSPKRPWKALFGRIACPRRAIGVLM